MPDFLTIKIAPSPSRTRRFSRCFYPLRTEKTHIYITPYLNTERITSGTLAYAVGSGKAVISTPYRYARELLEDGRGVLVPCKDSAAIAREVISLLGDQSQRKEIERRALGIGGSMTWPVVAEAYLKTFSRAVVEYSARSDMGQRASQIVKRPPVLPDVNLGHLRAMTDDTGMLQHAAWCVPRYEDGYCLDDNARALLLMTLVEAARIETPTVIRQLSTRYLAFVRHAFDPERGRFRNFLSYSRQWEEHGSEDSHARAMWSLGTVIGRSNDAGRCGLATLWATGRSCMDSAGLKMPMLMR